MNPRNICWRFFQVAFLTALKISSSKELDANPRRKLLDFASHSTLPRGKIARKGR
jgi:hypothetical protein